MKKNERSINNPKKRNILSSKELVCFCVVKYFVFVMGGGGGGGRRAKGGGGGGGGAVFLFCFLFLFVCLVLASTALTQILSALFCYYEVKSRQHP